MRPTRLAAAALALTLLAACKNSARTTAGAADTSAAKTTAAAPPAAPSASPRPDSAGADTSRAQAIPKGPIQVTCAVASKDLVNAISTGIKGVAGNAPIAVLSHAFAIRDPKSLLYYVSGTVTSADGGTPYVMTWATQSLMVGQGLIFAVTPGAQAVTIYPDSLHTVHPDNASSAAVASRQCVMKATGVTKGL